MTNFTLNAQRAPAQPINPEEINFKIHQDLELSLSQADSLISAALLNDFFLDKHCPGTRNHLNSLNETIQNASCAADLLMEAQEERFRESLRGRQWRIRQLTS